MRILYITADLPYPLSSGFFRHYHFLRALGRRHRITHFSLTSRPGLVDEAAQALDPYVERLVVFGVPAGGNAGRPEGIVHRLPAGGRLERALKTRAAVAEMGRAAKELLGSERFDVVLLSGKTTLPVVDGVRDVPLVVDACDATSLRIRGEMPFAGVRRRAWLYLRLGRALRIERKSVALTRHLAFASARDRAAMTGSPGRGEIVPQGVDLEYWSRSPGTAVRRPRLLLHGVMRYRPNDDAALFLAEEVGPRVRARIPEVDVVVVGRDPSPRLLDLAERLPWLTVTGAVEDLRTYFGEASVYCAPLRFASGIQNKILEAMAMEVPVVTTPVAAAGLALDGVEAPLVVAETADELAQAVVSLLGDETERDRLAGVGRRFVEEHYTWERSTAAIEALCEAASAAEEPARER